MVAAYPLHGICLDLFLFAVFLNTFPLLLVEMGKRERDRMKERKKERKKERGEREKKTKWNIFVKNFDAWLLEWQRRLARAIRFHCKARAGRPLLIAHLCTD